MDMKALILQCATEDDFLTHVVGEEFISFADMEYVGYVNIQVDIDSNMEDILHHVFSLCNDNKPKWLRYAIVTGDIIVIGNDAYRCVHTGWKKLELSQEDLELLEVIIETVEEENNESEENEMKDERIERGAERKAKEIVGTVKDGLKSASEAALGLCDDVAYEAKVISAMSQTEAENHIRRKFHCAADRFIEWITGKLGIELERSETADEILGEASEDTSRLKKALADFNKVKAEGEKKGWKKLTDILKAVFNIIFAIFIEVAKVVLKLAFALLVGSIKIGASMITTLMSCADIVGDDIVKPGVKAGKKAYTEFKGKRASKKGVSVDDVLDDDYFEED